MEHDHQHEKSVEILIVEDNVADVELMRELFSESKLANNVSVVNDGDAAMDFLYRQGRFAAAPRPDLILLDLGLPRKTGFEVLAEIKADPALRAIPVIILTSSSEESDILKCYNLHANSFISKPFHLLDFYNVLKVIEEFWFEIVKLPRR